MTFLKVLLFIGVLIFLSGRAYQWGYCNMVLEISHDPVCYPQTAFVQKEPERTHGAVVYTAVGTSTTTLGVVSFGAVGTFEYIER